MLHFLLRDCFTLSEQAGCGAVMQVTYMQTEGSRWAVKYHKKSFSINSKKLISEKVHNSLVEINTRECQKHLNVIIVYFKNDLRGFLTLKTTNRHPVPEWLDASWCSCLCAQQLKAQSRATVGERAELTLQQCPLCPVLTLYLPACPLISCQDKPPLGYSSCSKTICACV